MITNKPTIVLGAMNYGSTVSEQAARELLDHFVERGGRWIDTADCGVPARAPRGASERLRQMQAALTVLDGKIAHYSALADDPKG